ncbi:MAG: diaminopimelate epimerase [Actinomycetota bacterium]
MTGFTDSDRSVVHLTKHHGWGNDFLVVDVSRPGTLPPGVDLSDLARAWCDRRTGVGADGLLVLEIRNPAELGMILVNADGSRAEMSGNGIRCLVQAAHRSVWTTASLTSWPVRYSVETEAGPRIVDVLGPEADGVLHLSVDMGTVEQIGPPATWSSLGCHEDRPVRHVSLGNPHAVVGVDDVEAVDLAALGEKVPMVNLEIIEPGPEPDAVTMRVHERGAGLTMACGTGACAAAEAAVAWGLVPSSVGDVRVHMPGGDAYVHIDASTKRATLTGPAQFVASITVPV